MPPLATENALKLEGFALEVGDRVLLKEVDLSVDSRGITAVFGRSGTGKSTFLKALCQLTPCRGTIRLGGADIDQFKPEEIRTRIQYLHQEPWLFPGTVAENLAMPASFKHNPHPIVDDSLIRQHLESLGLGMDILEQEAEKLSGGEKQRVAMVRSLLLEPDYLLLDEPTSAMDVSSEEMTLAYLRELSQQMGIIAVSHSVELISTADRTLLLADGGITEITEELDRDAVRRMVENG